MSLINVSHYWDYGKAFLEELELKDKNPLWTNSILWLFWCFKWISQDKSMEFLIFWGFFPGDHAWLLCPGNCGPQNPQWAEEAGDGRKTNCELDFQFPALKIPQNNLYFWSCTYLVFFFLFCYSKICFVLFFPPFALIPAKKKPLKGPLILL